MTTSECPDKATYNFSPATGSNDLVYGSGRPGAKGKVCYTPDVKLPEEDVNDWVKFMKEQGIQKVVSLLTASELETYAKPIADSMKASFEYEHVDVKTAGLPAAVSAVQSAVQDGKKVVVHCWAGGGRAGQVLAAWLATHHADQFSPEQAAAEVVGTAAKVNASRRVDVEELRQVVAARL